MSPQDLDPIAWRMLERILAVAIGGMAIYLGYRLFIKVPESHDSHGRITFPWNISVVLSRVGPGVFFAVFGAAIVTYALHASVSYMQDTSTGVNDEGHVTVDTFRRIWGGIGPTSVAGRDEELQAARLRNRREMEFLNNLPSMLRADLTEEDRRRVSERQIALKLSIMESMWGTDWGDPQAFKDWAEGGPTAPMPKDLEIAAEYYLYGQKGAKR